MTGWEITQCMSVGENTVSQGARVMYSGDSHKEQAKSVEEVALRTQKRLQDFLDVMDRGDPIYPMNA